MNYKGHIKYIQDGARILSLIQEKNIYLIFSDRSQNTKMCVVITWPTKVQQQRAVVNAVFLAVVMCSISVILNDCDKNYLTVHKIWSNIISRKPHLKNPTVYDLLTEKGQMFTSEELRAVN